MPRGAGAPGSIKPDRTSASRAAGGIDIEPRRVGGGRMPRIAIGRGDRGGGVPARDGPPTLGGERPFRG